jgi:hypothetical protein
MIDEVTGPLAESRPVLIHGVSGSGKSSLVRAGVLPKLALQYSRLDAPWLTCAMRPSGGPLSNLATELARLEGRDEDLEHIDAIAARFGARSATLALTPIVEKTPIDVSHEALIRCWHRISDKESGWLQKEFRLGQGWRTFLFQAESFAKQLPRGRLCGEAGDDLILGGGKDLEDVEAVFSGG